MNAMPPMVRHQGAGVPGFNGRSQARADQDAEAFDRVLSVAGRVDRATDEPDATDLGEAAGDAPTARATDHDEAEAEPAAGVAVGLLPLLRIVVPQEKATEKAAPAGDAGAEESRPIGLEAEPATGDAPQPKDKAPASGATAAQSEPRPTVESRPAAETKPTAPTASVAADVPDENPRRVEVTAIPAAASHAGGSAPAASASLSLLARLNLMSQEGRTASAPARAASVEAAPEGSAAADAAAPEDAGETVARRVDKRSAGEETGNGATGRREPSDGTGRTAERAAPIAVPSPQAGPQASVSAQVVQALAASPAATAAAQAVVAAHKDDASAAEPMQSLKIQLRPHELGQVTAKLSMVGGELSIEIEVDTIEAHRALSGDSDAIVKALRAQGIAVDQVTIQQPPQSTAAGRDGAGGDTPAFAGRDARDSGSSGNSAGRNQTSQPPDRDHGHETRSTAEGIAPSARSVGDVYI